MSKTYKSIRSPIVRHLNKNIALHVLFNQPCVEEEADTLNAAFKKHFAHDYHTKTQALLAHGELVASLHDGFVERVTERRIPGSDQISTVVIASAYFYDAKRGEEVGRGEVEFTFTGTERLRKMGNFQNRRIFEAVIDMDSKRIGLTLCPSFRSKVVVEFPFESIDIAINLTDRYDDRPADTLLFLEDESMGVAP